MVQIDSTSRFLVQLREQIAAAARKDSTRTSRTTAARKAEPRDVQRLILQRVQAIDASDPDRRRKAFRVFLESVLVDELGDELLTDPGYHQVVENVHRTMEGNPALVAAIDKAGEFLLKTAVSK